MADFRFRPDGRLAGGPKGFRLGSSHRSLKDVAKSQREQQEAAEAEAAELAKKTRREAMAVRKLPPPVVSEPEPRVVADAKPFLQDRPPAPVIELKSVAVTEALLWRAVQAATDKSHVSKHVRGFETQLRTYCAAVLGMADPTLKAVSQYVYQALKARIGERRVVRDFDDLVQRADGIIWEVEARIKLMAMRGDSEGLSATRGYKIVTASFEERPDMQAVIVFRNKRKNSDPTVLSIAIKPMKQEALKKPQAKSDGYVNEPVHRRKKRFCA